MARLATGGTTRRRRTAAAMVAAGPLLWALGACAQPRSVESFCTQLGTVRDLDQVLAGADAPRAAELAEELRELRAVAPEDLDPSIARLSAVTDDLSRTLATTPDPSAAAREVFTRRQGELADITAAGRAVESFAAEHCHVVLNPNATTTPPPPPTTAAPTSRPATSTSRRPATSRATTTTRARRATTTSRRPSGPSTTTTRRR